MPAMSSTKVTLFGIILLYLGIGIPLLHADPQLIVAELKNNSDFKEKCWNISKEFTADLKKSLSEEFSIVKAGKNVLDSIVIYGNITEFDIKSREYSAMPLIGQRSYTAKITIEIYFSTIPAGNVIKIVSTKEKTFNKVTGFFAMPEEEDEINTRIADFDKRDKIKWGSEEFKKSVIGIACEEAIKDVTGKIEKRINP